VRASEVSAFDPQPLAEPKLDLPEFVVVKRGVDRRQVEEWGRKLTSVIEQERRRADQAEKALYRMQIEAKGTPSFSHLGSHVADIIEEAGRSAEKMLLDAAERAQEAIDGAEADGAEIITAAEAQAGEIEGAARQEAEQVRVEGVRIAEETRQAADAFRAQTEEEASSLLEEAREATDQLREETEQECAAVEAETRRLEVLRQRTHQRLGRMYGHLESVLEEIRLGIDGAQPADEEAAVEAAAPAEPATGGRQARPANAKPQAEAETETETETTLPTVDEARPAAARGSHEATQPQESEPAAARRARTDTRP
jgi:cell division septum initiation protein DivIVA